MYPLTYCDSIPFYTILCSSLFLYLFYILVEIIHTHTGLSGVWDCTTWKVGLSVRLILQEFEIDMAVQEQITASHPLTTGNDNEVLKVEWVEDCQSLTSIQDMKPVGCARPSSLYQNEHCFGWLMLIISGECWISILSLEM